jgi:electron transfer flavoprotein alpha subunit
MSVLVFLESSEGIVKKSSLEAVVYARSLAAGEVHAMVAGSPSNLSEAAEMGAARIHSIADARFQNADAAAFSEALAQLASQIGTGIIVLAKSAFTDSLAARCSVLWKAGLATNVTGLPESGFQLKRSIFTGKAFETVSLNAERKIISIRKNAVEVSPAPAAGEVVTFQPEVSSAAFALKSLALEKTSGEVLLSDAEIVVSGGRGLKGPENWALVTDMAKVLGAATGCSKPVSDLHWRPHHEHVGQTGIKVSPNLYFAIGISGAIQHVAGISSSKVIVAINKDADAPIFKVANYGIVGDAFDVVPKLTQALREAL